MKLMNFVLKLAVPGTRIFLGLIFFTSGMGKLTRGDYPGLIGPVWLEELLAPHGLGLWARFLAWSQVTIGLLLLSQRFATLGAIMLLPMIANILVITISMQFGGTEYINGFLLLLNLFLLAADYHKIKFLFFDDARDLRPVRLERRRPAIDGLCLFGLALCLASAPAHSIDRRLTFGLSLAGLLIFSVCALLAAGADDKRNDGAGQVDGVRNRIGT